MLTPAGQPVTPRGQGKGNAISMRSLILGAYAVALLLTADYTPFTAVLLAALVAFWAFPLLLKRSRAVHARAAKPVPEAVMP